MGPFWCKYTTLSLLSSFLASGMELDGLECHKNTLVVPPTVTSRPSLLTIAHRGASSHLPEHTIAAYRLALELGAEYIETDLVATSDSVLFALHTADLNVTTNVEEVFSAERNPWYSPSQGRAGYWSFNFTADEIRQLRVRQRLPASRSTMYDGMFGVPTLNEILDVLQRWNEEDLPARLNITARYGVPSDGKHPHPLQKFKSGVYVEFKEADWIREEAGIDLVDLVFDHIANKEHRYWNDLLRCFESIRFDEYMVPGLVLESFDPTDLQRFHNRWHSESLVRDHVEPPYILLVNREHCFKDEFWFKVGDSWRSFLSGIGCEKSCLMSGSSHAVIEKALQFGLILHPWTERPEAIFRRDDSLLQEMMYLKCNTSGVVRGLFSESVDQAIRAALEPCPREKNLQELSGANPTNCKASGGSILAALVLGTVVAMILGYGSKILLAKQRTGTDNMTRVPTSEIPSSLELT